MTAGESNVHGNIPQESPIATPELATRIHESGVDPSHSITTDTGKIATEPGETAALPTQSISIKKEARVRIIVTGDVFEEQYIWRDVETAVGSELPFTSPDELRTANPSRTKREPSGAILHCKIFKEMLEKWSFNSKIDQNDFEIESVGLFNSEPTTTVENGKSRDSIEAHPGEANPYALYMHELAPFPRIAFENESHRDYVWRIKHSYGRVTRIPDPTLLPADEAEERAHKQEELNHNAEEDRNVIHTQDVIMNGAFTALENKVKSLDTPTVVVISDRNVFDRRDLRHKMTTDGEDTARNKFEEFSFRESLRQQLDKIKLATNDAAGNLDNLIVLWHTRFPILKNPIARLFQEYDKLTSATIPIISYHCLCQEGIPLRFDMSFESSIRVLLESAQHELVRMLLRFPHVLIRFDYGILHMVNKNGRLAGLDVHAFNGGFQRFDTQRQGMMVGTTPLIIAALLREIIDHRKESDTNTFKSFLSGPHIDSDANTPPSILANTRIDRAIDAGLLLTGLHFDLGFGDYDNKGVGLKIRNCDGTLDMYKRLAAQFYGKSDFMNIKVKKEKEEEETASRYQLQYAPNAKDADRDRLIRLSASGKLLGSSRSATGKRKTFSRIELLDDKRIAMQSAIYNREPLTEGDTFDWFLRNIVRYGFKRVFSRQPSGKMLLEPSLLCPYVASGNYASIDTQDIDAFLALRNLVESYVSQRKSTKPLALAVFGPPGSGKSFMVKEVLKGMRQCSLDDDLKLNLSQVSSIELLGRFFHRIQDAGARGAIPVAFIDEFDGRWEDTDVGWLKHFLMALQDGEYSEGGQTYDLKRAILVFAGGVTESFSAFEKKFGSLREQKVPDFLSRLRGYLDVQSLSMIGTRSEISSESRMGPGVEGDRAAQLRRAVILRSILGEKLPQIVDRGSDCANVEDQIINGFVHVSRFKYGVRSMEAIVEMSRVSPNTHSFLRSALPSASQIVMHVDPDEFFAIVHAE